MNIEVSPIGVDGGSIELSAVHPGKKRQAEHYSPSLLKSKSPKPDGKLINLPRFGAKLSATPADVERLQRRLEEIYKTKLQAFKWPRYREIVLTEKADGAAKKRAESFTGRLDTTDMSVEMTRFRGTFSSYFGKHFQKDNESRTILSPFEAFFLMDMGTLEVNISDSCILATEDVRAMMEEEVPNFSRRYAVFSELHRATQLYAKPYGTPHSSAKNSKSDASKRHLAPSSAQTEKLSTAAETPALLRKSTSMPPPEPLLSLAVSNERSERIRAVVEDARRLLGLEATPPPREAVSLEASTEMDEIPPFSVTGWTYPSYPCRPVVNSKSEAPPETFDVAFTCYSRIAAIGTTAPQFDVALTDFYRRDIPISDLFLVLASRNDPNLPLYVAKEDHGLISGFAAVLADIPTVSYQGFSDS